MGPPLRWGLYGFLGRVLALALVFQLLVVLPPSHAQASERSRRGDRDVDGTRWWRGGDRRRFGLATVCSRAFLRGLLFSRAGMRGRAAVDRGAERASTGDTASHVNPTYAINNDTSTWPFDRRVGVARLNRALERLAWRHGRVTLSKIAYGDAGQFVYVARVRASPGEDPPAQRPVRVLVTAGIHGNEAAGVRVAMRLLRRALTNGAFGRHFGLTVVPAISPYGLSHGDRYAEPESPVNLNRMFGVNGAEPSHPIAQAIERALAPEAFDVSVDLHGSERFGLFAIWHRGKEPLQAGPSADGVLAKAVAELPDHTLLTAPDPTDPHAREGYVSAYRIDPGQPGRGSVTVPCTFMSYASGELGVPLAFTLEYARRMLPWRQTPWFERLTLSVLHHSRLALADKAVPRD